MKNTKYQKCAYKNAAETTLSVLFFILSIFSVFSVIAFSDDVSEHTKAALQLCYNVIIPTIFPFMLLSDLLVKYIRVEKIRLIDQLFTAVFKIGGAGATAFICGIFCGFPIGFKIARDLYIDGVITRDECESLICFSNNASPAFVICGVGLGLRESLFQGIALYVIMLISSIISGIVFAPKNNTNSGHMNAVSSSPPYSLSDSMQSAVKGTLNACGFIVLFSIVIGIFDRIFKNEILTAFFSLFMEIGNAARTVNETASLGHEISFVLTAFAISFSGFSVHFQSKSFLSGTDISMKRYYASKLFSGIVSAILASIFLLSKNVFL